MLREFRCCFKECGDLAEWAIRPYGKSQELNTHSCAEHVGDLLDPVLVNMVYSIDPPPRGTEFGEGG